MELSLFLIKLILMFGFVGLMFAPLAGLLSSFKSDCEKNNAHKRFRLVIFAAVYFLAVSLVLIFVADLLEWIKSWGVIRWLADHIGLPDRLEYSAAVFTAVLLNFFIGLLYYILTPFVRVGLKKKKLDLPKRKVKDKDGEEKDEDKKDEGKEDEKAKKQGKGKDEKPLRKLEIKIVAFFHEEKWFFAAHVLKYLNIAMIVIFALVFILYPIPALWKFSWLPIDKVFTVFNAGYHYPVLTLLPLIEFNLFLYGVSLYKIEDEEKPKDKVGTRRIDPALEEIDKNCRNEFKFYYADEIEGVTDDGESSIGEHHEITKAIARGVEKDRRRPRKASELYMQCLDTIVNNDIDSLVYEGGNKTKGVLVNASFYSEFSEYFLRYASVILSRGDNMIFICNDDSQILDTEKYIRTALEQMYSLYHVETDRSDIDFNYSVWKVISHTSESSYDNCEKINNCSVLVTDLNFLTSSLFETRCSKFIHLVDTVVFVDMLTTVNAFSHQMSIFDVSMKNIREENAVKAKNCGENASIDLDPFAVRYVSNQIKYVCFDDSRVPGWDRVLSNLLYVDFISANAMKYNPSVKVVLYNFEARANEKGEHRQVDVAQTNENLSVLINISDFAVGFGAGKVSVLADRLIPYRDLKESAEANKGNGLRLIEDTNFSINKHSYNSDSCRVFVAFDDVDNLPMAIRRYSSMASDRPTLVMIFSRSYMFRDYYLDNIEELWKPEQLLRIPFEQQSRENAIRKILIKANSGGISFKEIFDILRNANIDDYKNPVAEEDINEVLRLILIDSGHADQAFAWNNYFECYYFDDYTCNGKFVSEDRVRLRRKGMLYDLLPATRLASMYISGKHMEIPLSIPQSRITQNYIAGQNMLYRGIVYTINNIDTVSGKIYVNRAAGGQNDVPYHYIQDREYHIDFSNSTPEIVYPVKSVSFMNSAETKVSEATVAVTRRPMEVITKGYLPIDPRTMEKNAAYTDEYTRLTGDENIEQFKQTYRRYGNVETPICSSETIMNGSAEIAAFSNEAIVMSLKLTGEFGENADRIARLASVMIGEVLAAMFPSVTDSIAVCPVLSKQLEEGEFENIRRRLPELVVKGRDAAPNTIEILIIEDAPHDLGVISVLMASGDNVVKMLFGPINKYLEWYSKETVKSKYLYFGEDEEPKCFDFEGLGRLAHAIGDEKIKHDFRNVQDVTRYDVCDFCGKRYLRGTDDVTVLEDGRKICRSCRQSIVNYDKKTLDEHLDRARIYLESTYGVRIDRDSYEFCFESTSKIVKELNRNRDLVRRGSDVPLKSYMNADEDTLSVHVEYTIPSTNLSELLVRELTHIWQRKNLPALGEELAEGHIALVAIQYLRFLNQHSMASLRTSYYESTGNASGVGYRALVRELLLNPQFANNPFTYLLHSSGKDIEEEITHRVPRITDDGDYGKPYTAQTSDRALDGNITYFYYSRLTATHQKLYDTLIEAIREHREIVPNAGYSAEDLKKVCSSILYDHPELFWFNWVEWDKDNNNNNDASRIKLLYGVSREERDVLQRRIDEVVPKYLEGIDDSMSAYDVAVRMHVKIIKAVDYDTIALERQKKAGGPKNDEIDYLRTICGIFLKGTAVCEGYARGLQYLLQKCGIECAEAVGDIRKDTGERGGPHAWNIVKIDGDYYYIDTTWDDGSNTVQTVRNTDFGFDYFCVTSEEMSRTRYTNSCPTDMPPCDAVRANYYVHNDLVIDRFDVDKLCQISRAAAEAKKKSFSFKCATPELYNEIFERFTKHDPVLREPATAAGKVDKEILNGYAYTYNKHIKTFTYYFSYNQ